ncbi:ABC transporter ATP-binding protein [Ornithinicoccus hortensis]|uniref:ATP-binding cassette subfamily C protein n=1 Tax=Ornithinicoccus hortensis TaxID=82346 RepID=A0A542YUI2_9MICO|nr:ABC transporter ATP-binding protein [Ornithinicoccus hortensis]TQL51741.1 ATP-binding cassette subfamily C protein [Ornithinicoccus hortensis]
MSEPALLPVATGRQGAATVWTMLRGRRIRLLGVLALFCLEAATTLVVPLAIGSVVDGVIAADGSGVPTTFWWQVALLVGAAVASGVLAWLGPLTLARLAETVIAELREAHVTAALGLPRARFEQAGSGDVVTRASDDISRLSEVLPDVLPRLAVSAFTILLVGAGLGSLDLRYVAGFLVVVPLYAWTLRWYVRTAPTVYAAERAAGSERSRHILGTLENLPTVTAHRLAARQLRLVRGSTWQVVRWAMRTRIVQNRLFGRLNVIELIGLAIVLLIGVLLAARGSGSVGSATAAALLFLRIVAPIEALLLVTHDLQAALAALGRVVGVIRLTGSMPAAPEPGVTPPAGPAPATGRDHGPLLRLRDVHYAYLPHRPVLQGVSLDLSPGRQVAVVGATGSGKSTLASVVAGVHRPDSGSLDSAVPPERIVTVTHEVHVFAATLRDNLTLAAPDATEEEVFAALRAVGADGLVAGLPEGLDTRVGAGGHPLGPAQAQHLALARLVLADPPLAVLDEATAEADTADAHRLEEAAAAALEGRAALLVAHRLSQARAADEVLVLEDGRVVESGTHGELVASGGRYAGLWRAWSADRVG